MSAEAEKVISLSLCKIAETRGTRRGGTSLHKHLLIASVLSKATRARTAFLDTWYMGDDDSAEGIDLNMSYQEGDFPTDELDSNVGESSVIDLDQLERGTICSNNNDNPLLGDPRFGNEGESEIDLPPDILHCVEKLGDLNERIFSHQSASTSATSFSSSDHPPAKSLMFAPSQPVIPDVISNPPPQSISPVTSTQNKDIQEDTQLTTTLTYLDLDAGSSIVERGPSATSTPTKRRREWCFDDDEDDDEDCGSRNGLYKETSGKPRRTKIASSPFGKNCSKRLRFDDSGLSTSPEKTIEEDGTGVPSSRADNASEQESFKSGSFRLTYEDVDGDDSDDDSFLEDALSQGLQSPSQIEIPNKTRHRNDRRVPSASSSGSCSDEDADGESSMEVDQITNLVQFISFNKQQQQQSQSQTAPNLRSVSCVN